MQTKKIISGFTLIELLVVIAIIGLLASVVSVSLSTSRVKARDARRQADVKQLMTALALYYEANGQYPVSGGSLPAGVTPPVSAAYSNSNDPSWDTLQTAMTPYLTKLPQDPKQDPLGWPPSANFSYVYLSNPACGAGSTQGFMIVYKLEIAAGPDPGVFYCGGGVVQWGGTGATTSLKTVGVAR